MYDYFVSTDCELCQATARGINEWVVRNAGYLTSYETRKDYISRLRNKRDELRTCIRDLCVDPYQRMGVSGAGIALPGDPALPDGAAGMRTIGETDDAETPIEDEAPQNTGVKRMSAEETGFRATPKPGFEVRAGIGWVWFGDLEDNVGIARMEASARSGAGPMTERLRCPSSLAIPGDTTTD